MYFVKHRADLFGLNNGKNLAGGGGQHNWELQAQSSQLKD